MHRFRLVMVSLVVAVAAAGVASGCSDRSGEPSNVISPSSGPARIVAPSPGGSARGDDVRRKFHESNSADWVGAAHNRAIDDYRARLRHGDVNHDMCRDLVEFMSDERRLPERARAGSGSRAQRSSVARRALQQESFCAEPLAMTSLGGLLSLTQGTGVSAATQALLDQVSAAAAVAPTSGDLAAALLPIVESSASLPNGEGDVVSATASVAQSSMEYWEANLDAVRLEYDQAYGSCAVGSTSVDDLALRCLGMSSRSVAPTTYRGGGHSIMHLTQGTDFSHCNAFNGREILGDDVKGGIAGAVAGFFSSGVGALPGAAIGAGGSSLGAAGWQWAQTTFCVLGGPAVKQPRQKAT